MYHPILIAEAEARTFKSPPLRYSISDSRALTKQIAAVADAKGTLLRALTPEEQSFVDDAQLLVMIDFEYFASRFITIDREGSGIRPLYPLWEGQRFFLKKLGDLQYQRQRDGYPDGLFFNVLKARQEGISTIGEALLAHLILTQTHIRALCGADVEEQAAYLFRMVERIFTHLPWFLQPSRRGFNKDRELILGNHCTLRTAWGKSTRGALQEGGMKKGHIGRGRTYSAVHISELATWENAAQLDSALFPGIPRTPTSLCILESTAEVAGDWWHKHWLATEEGTGRFVNLFIPWCVEPQKYSLPPPADWSPSTLTLQTARKIEADAPNWIGHAVTLTRAQLYWYESTRAYFEKKGRLHDFLREYPSNADEAFQYAGRSIFTLDQLDLIDRLAKPLIDVWDVQPAREVAELRRLDVDKAVEEGQPLPTPAAPLTPALSSKIAEQTFPVPPGYGFRRLPKTELQALPALLNVLAIYEYPRTRGQRRYVMSVDVGDGLNTPESDFSDINIIRQPTIEENAEQVAHYRTKKLSPSQLASVCDAIGRLYPDEDGIEALAAIETNNHGLSTQDTLQLHLGYAHFYVWEVADAASQEKRFTQRIGWYTTPRTRPMLLDKFVESITTIDPISGVTDLRLNAPATRRELRHFISVSGKLEDAEAAPGQHDDGIMSAGIGYYVAWRLAGGEAEPIAERRKRRSALRAMALESGASSLRDWRNSAVSAASMKIGVDDDDEFSEESTGLHFDPRQYE
jgi:hypothetical protein